jgi:penicillin-binding protein 1C
MKRMALRQNWISFYLKIENKAKIIGQTPIRLKHCLGYGLALLLGYVLLFCIFAFPPRYPLFYSPIVRDRTGKVIAVYLSKDQKWRLQTTLSGVPPYLIQALLWKEDKYFYYHPGVNPASVIRALWKNIQSGKRTSGASTITMQVIRLLHPKKRTYAAKIWEALGALQLELLLSKNEILQLYLELLPYGGNIEGVEAAAWAYFQKPLKALNVAELTTLVLIPNRPQSLAPPNVNLLIEQRNKWLNKFASAHLFPSTMLPVYLQEPLSLRRHPFPKNAPHFANKVYAISQGEPCIYTTLCLEKQNTIERLVQNYARHIALKGISNAAVLAIDNATAEIIAYVGSVNFYDKQSQGQVDGVQAVRSPGSALKPLLFALAIDSGLITPQTVLLDTPYNYGGYNPENYDGQFRGKVTASFALANSLNIPAVELLRQIDKNTFIKILEKAEFRSVAQQKSQLGLSMILGGCGARLQELVSLYAAFAHHGVYRPLRMLKQEKPSTQTQLFSPEAAYLVTEALTQLERPDLPHHFETTLDLPKVAWKTGTSYGRRDAWSVGYTPRYTVGVWCGNFTGVGNPALSGAEVATPLLFEIMRYLEQSSRQHSWFTRPPNLAMREVCVETGMPPDTFCKKRVWDSYIPAASPTQKCAHKKAFWVAPNRKMSYCNACLPPDGLFDTELYTVYPPALLNFYWQKGVRLKLAPPHNPACNQILSAGLQISSLHDGAEYFIEKKNPARLALEAQTDEQARQLFWFVGDKWIGQCSTQEKVFFLPPDSGWYAIVCADDRGRKDKIKIRVIYY